MPTKKSKSSKAAKAAAAANPKVPNIIYAQASPHSAGGVSLFDSQEHVRAATALNFFSEMSLVQRAAAKLRAAGFDVLQISPTTINIAGSAETYRRAFNTRIVAEERATMKGPDEDDHATFLDSPDTHMSGLIATRGTQFEDVLEGVALEEARYFNAPSMFAPAKTYWHLDVPGGVSLGCNADRAHRTGITGKGVKVAMADSGWFKHPYFVERGYKVSPVVLGPAAINPLNDEVGHGTGESANIFAVAPDAELLPVKINFVNTVGGFNAAVALKPDIITCSWGSHKPLGALSAADLALAAAVAAAVTSGITVIFSAGNGSAGFPGQHPDVISAGGAFMNPDGTFQASNYASGFMSNVYAGRRVPDVCGLVGMQPKAIYIMLPLEPGDTIDVGNAGLTHPNGDETPNNDGWAAFSGTSAAAPQLAGVAALIKQACPKLTPAQIKDVMRKTARDVTTGTCSSVGNIHGGLAAAVGPDTATGDGLVDAHKAVMLAKVKCLPIITPGPITPSPGVAPGPITPSPGVTPGPITPSPGVAPGPITPGPITPGPITPAPPHPPFPPSPPVPIGGPTFAAGTAATATGGGLSADDASMLEEMVLQSEIELD